MARLVMRHILFWIGQCVLLDICSAEAWFWHDITNYLSIRQSDVELSGQCSTQVVFANFYYDTYSKGINCENLQGLFWWNGISATLQFQKRVLPIFHDSHVVNKWLRKSKDSFNVMPCDTLWGLFCFGRHDGT